MEEEFKDKANLDNFNIVVGRFQESNEEYYNTARGDGEYDYDDDGEMEHHDGSLIKYRTFSEFMYLLIIIIIIFIYGSNTFIHIRYGALTELGGTASLSKIYQFVFAHQSDIDPKCIIHFSFYFVLLYHFIMI